MDNIGWLIYIISFSIGLLSYLICIVLKKREQISVSQYLFCGNSKFTSPISIIGAFFSVAFLYSTLPTIYLIYGKSIFFVAVISSWSGLWILKKKVTTTWVIEDPVVGDLKNLSDKSPNEHNLLYSKPNNQFIFFIINLLYLFFVLMAEVAAFSYGVKSLDLGDVWSPISVYVICALILLYVYKSGFRGVLITDVFQIIVLLIALCIFGILVYNQDKNYLFFPKPVVSSDILLFGWISAFIMGVSWVSSAPELWIRLTTLRKKNDIKSTVNISILGVPFLFLIPLIWLNMIDIEFNHIDLSSTYAIWNNIIVKSSIVPTSLGFIVVIITAFFTTVDTFVITLSQMFKLLKNRYFIIDDLIGNKLRKYSIVICSLSILLGCYFPVNLSFVLGILAYNITIPAFFIIYLIPWVSEKIPIQRLPNSIFSIPLILSLLFTVVVVYPKVDNGEFVYHYVPIVTFLLHLTPLIFVFTNAFLKRGE